MNTTTAAAATQGIKHFLSTHPGLEEALRVGHSTLHDMACKLARYGSLSDKQVAFALKLAKEASGPAEVHVVAPTGRVVVRGLIVSIKSKQTDFGPVLKMTVKVTTPEGSWLAWSSVPDSLALGAGWQTVNEDGSPCEQSADYVPRASVGDEVEFTATLSTSDTPHFAFAKRPTKARLVASKRPAGKVVSNPV